MQHPVKRLLVIFLILAGFALGFHQVHGQEAVVRAVLFYSPTCPHCETVINEVIPPLGDRYGNRLQIFGVNTHTETGFQLFMAAIEKYDIPKDRQAVPTLIIGDHVLVGSQEIPQKLPSLVEKGLAAGGIDWPYFPGLAEEIQKTNQDVDSPPAGQDQEVAGGSEDITLGEKFTADLAGNVLATLILVGMISTLVFVGKDITQPSTIENPPSYSWLIPLLALLGLVVATYLSYVEITQTDAVCGPVGRCNTVQQSPYATLFGFLPVGVIGVVGYAFITGAWLLVEIGPTSWSLETRFSLWGFTLIGTLFSVYLTFLEPFVIGASCLWCLSSAVTITVLFLLASRELMSKLQRKGYLRPN